MRALVVSIWVFINLVFFGMCSYMYLLWSQYWMYLEKETQTASNNYEQQIYLYNRGYALNDTSKYKEDNPSEIKNRTKHATKENNTITIIKNSKPRFPNLQSEEFLLDTDKYKCTENDSNADCDLKIAEYQEKILNELKRVFLDESNVLKSGLETMNPYNVQYRGRRGNFMNKARRELLCELRKVRVETLKRNNPSLLGTILRDYLPRKGLFENKRFKSCAIVASSGSLKGSSLGKFIDSHELVLRFNHAPTKGYETDVGSKTTIRILNSQVVTKSQYHFLTSPLYRNITLLAWDPSNYSSSLAEWYQRPEYDLFPFYMRYRRGNIGPKGLTEAPIVGNNNNDILVEREGLTDGIISGINKEMDDVMFAGAEQRQGGGNRGRFYILDPSSLWRLWDYLQSNAPNRLRRNPPSSGFLGLSLLLPVCDYVDVMEYVPSVRVTRKCHYYDRVDNAACTFGVWHPLAAEKLLTYSLNIADDRTVFGSGYVRVAGFKFLQC